MRVRCISWDLVKHQYENLRLLVAYHKCNKKLSYRQGAARHVLSVKTVQNDAQC